MTYIGSTLADNVGSVALAVARQALIQPRNACRVVQQVLDGLRQEDVGILLESVGEIEAQILDLCQAYSFDLPKKETTDSAQVS